MHSSKYARSSFRFQFAYHEPSVRHIPSPANTNTRTPIDSAEKQQIFCFSTFLETSERKKSALAHSRVRAMCERNKIIALGLAWPERCTRDAPRQRRTEIGERTKPITTPHSNAVSPCTRTHTRTLRLIVFQLKFLLKITPKISEQEEKSK